MISQISSIGNPQIIEGLHAQGYRFVTVTQLLEIDWKHG